MTRKPRRANGDGYIYQRKGRYYIQLYTVDATGNRVRKWLRGGASVISANRKLREYKEKHFICLDSTQTLGQWLQSWIDRYSKGKAESTISLYRRLIRVHLMPTVGQVKLTDLKPAMFSKLYATLSKQLAPKTILTINSILNAALNQAVKDEIIFRNVLHAVTKPRTRKPEHRIFSEDELRAFYEKCLQSQYRLPYLLMLFGGLRRGEALGMKWSAVDLVNNTVTVRQQLTERQTPAGPCIEIGQLKTERSYRVIPLPTEVMDEFKKTQAKQRHGLIFKGRSKSPRCFVADFKRITAELGIEGMRLHSLRHTHASFLLMSGVALPMVSDRLGHSGTKVTGDIYSHAVPGAQDAAVSALSSLARRITAEAGANPHE
jgi:integrase